MKYWQLLSTSTKLYFETEIISIGNVCLNDFRSYISARNIEYNSSVNYIAIFYYPNEANMINSEKNTPKDYN